MVDYRSPAQHDRDRIVYCSAFRRLAYVTQVTAPEAGHAFHSRLSHSYKVAQVGRRNAERLRAIAGDGGITGAAGETVLSIDPDAVEAACLAHDLGHPPFGHIAEAALTEQAQEFITGDGVFEGNAQSFRIVTRLAQRANGSGLNLTRQTLDGILKYPWKHWNQDPLSPDVRERKWGYYLDDVDAYEFARRYRGSKDDKQSRPAPSIEALIMEWADDLTYAVHDVDDFVRAELIPLHRLASSTDDESKRFIELMEEAQAADYAAWPKYTAEELAETVATIASSGHGPSGRYHHTQDHRREMRKFGSALITRYVGAFRVEDRPDTNEVRVTVDPQIVREVEALKMLVRVYVIRRPGLAVVQHGQQRLIRELFAAYHSASAAGPSGDRRIFPAGAKRTLDDGEDDQAERARVIVDLIAGLTERNAVELHRRLTGRSTAVTLDATALMA
jgi:dGTPase